jgi:hypothetical protein
MPRELPIWFARVEVRPLPGNDLLQGAAGAFVNLLGRACCMEDLEKAVRQHFHEHNFEVVKVEEPELLAARLARGAVVDDALLDLVHSFPSTEFVRFDKMFSYEAE